jgi:hypothetical protein
MCHYVLCYCRLSVERKLLLLIMPPTCPTVPVVLFDLSTNYRQQWPRQVVRLLIPQETAAPTRVDETPVLLLGDTTADYSLELVSMPISTQIRLKRNMELASSSDSNTSDNTHSLGKGTIVNLEALQLLTMPKYSSPFQSQVILYSGCKAWSSR